MSRKAVKRLEKFYMCEDVKGFEKDADSGFYRLVEQKVTRETESNTITSSPVEKSTDLYQMCSESEAEKTYKYQDFDGKDALIFFKKVLN